MKFKKSVLGAILLLVMASVASVGVLQATSTLQVTLVTTGNFGLCTVDGVGFGLGVATASGGTGPYTFTWSRPARQLTSDTANPNRGIINGPGGTTPAMRVTVTSADGQSVTVSKKVSITCGGIDF